MGIDKTLTLAVALTKGAERKVCKALTILVREEAGSTTIAMSQSRVGDSKIANALVCFS